MALAAQANGVSYISGQAGYVKKLLYVDSGKCIGCLSADGHAHVADTVVLSIWANTAALVDAKDEVVARSHCVGVIQLTPEEIKRYSGLPIVDNFEQGQFHLVNFSLSSQHANVFLPQEFYFHPIKRNTEAL